MEIRLHGRGGQGGVTCAKILAAMYARQGKSVQTFGDYAGERSGAPVRAYTRVEDSTITNRNKVYEPDHLLVLDPTLLGAEVVSGLRAGGTFLLNSPAGLGAFGDGEPYPAFRLAVLDATEIARRHGIGTRSVVIVNTTLAGAFAHIMGLPRSLLEEAYRDLGLESNLPAALEAYEAVVWRDPLPDSGFFPGGGKPEEAPPDGRTPVEPLAAHLAGPPTGLKTGTWRTQMPHYTEQLAPCSAWCPAGNQVIEFVQAVAREGAGAAAAILVRTTPFAGVCGRVCPAPCMEGCNRTEFDGAVNIRGLERWIADHAEPLPPPSEPDAIPRRLAVVGGGPAGLSAAWHLARHGHRVTILEGERELGGVLRTGIPTYRLPREVLDTEIARILALGVETRCGEFLDRERVAALTAEYDGVVLATGLQKLRALDVPGADLEGVEQGIRFLHRINLEGGARLSGHVVVCGGGNTAMDCARSALRCGAERVTILYRRGEEEMPAIREEIFEAREEGVVFELLRQPVAFLGEERVRAIRAAEVELGEPDESGRRRPVVSDRTSELACDHVLLALGQSADGALVPGGWELREGRFFAGDEPLPVFGAGDFATGDGTVTHALGSGRRAAGLLRAALGEAADPFQRPDRKEAVPVTDIRLDHFLRATPAREQVRRPAARIADFSEVSGGLSDALESHRCFSCGHCTQCDTCLVYCPEGIIRRQTDHDYEVDYTYCKGCGICVEECPRKAMEMTLS